MAFTVVPTIVDGDDATDDFPIAVKAVADQLSTIKALGEVGPDSAGPTVGTTPLTVDTITIPAPGIAGHVVAWGTAVFTKTVAGDAFSLTLQIAASSRCTWRSPNLSAGNPTVEAGAVIGSHAVNGLTDIVIDIILTRIAGTGTATVGAGSNASLGYIFVPAP
jgi:hypothetical protein